MFRLLANVPVSQYADNLLKGFATALAIIFSFVAGVILFEFHITVAFVIGTAVVVGATVLYNQDDPHATQLPQPASSKVATPPTVHYAQQPVYQSGSTSPLLHSRSSSPTRGVAASVIVSSPGVAGPYRRSPQTGSLTPDLLATSFDRLEAHTVQMPAAEDGQWPDTRTLSNGLSSGLGCDSRKQHHAPVM